MVAPTHVMTREQRWAVCCEMKPSVAVVEDASFSKRKCFLVYYIAL